ncbi:MAG: hypothetical protein AB7R89_05735 [Dehalococcoidia bacterium]
MIETHPVTVRQLPRRTVLVAVTVLAVLLTSPMLGQAPVAVAQSPSQQSQTFTCTGVNGGRQNFTVPAGVTQLHVEAHGGQGQGRSGALPGGDGGSVIATVPVTPGTVLDVWAGCSGDNNSGVGWGAGGTHGIAHAGDAQDGGFGGGGSGVVAPNLVQLVVAGGGGGGGGNSAGSGIAGQGGNGGNGGINPQPGGQGGVGPFGTGSGPDGGCAACLGMNNGNGASGDDSTSASGGGGGGGGGGGYIGGGGGHGSNGFATFEGGGGGGGGLSYVTPSATNVSYGTDTSGGDGIVILAWASGGPGQTPPGQGPPSGFPSLTWLPAVRCGETLITTQSLREFIDLWQRCGGGGPVPGR